MSGLSGNEMLSLLAGITQNPSTSEDHSQSTDINSTTQVEHASQAREIAFDDDPFMDIDDDYETQRKVQRQLDYLQFSNPGGQMQVGKTLDRSMRRSKTAATYQAPPTAQQILVNKSVNSPTPAQINNDPHHDHKGRLCVKGKAPAYQCDCLRLGCPGCHMPCVKCSNMPDDSRVPLLADDSNGSADGPLKAKLHRMPMPRIAIGRESSSSSNMRTAVLIWLTLQNSVHTLLIRYSRAREVDEMFLSTAAVFFTEVIKGIICIILVAKEETPAKLGSSLMEQVVRQPYDTLKVCIPAMIYIVQNNLFYVAASHLDAATFMITSQLKIFTAAIFTVIILRRSLSRVQWFALAVLFIGVSMVQLQTSNAKEAVLNNQRPVVGFVAVVTACCLSGFAGIYFEKILKGSAPVSLWMRNVQMGVFAIPASFLGVFLQDGSFVMQHGILYGFDWVVWLTVLWYGIGGLSVAVCIKYADNIAKNFATSVAIILSTIGSVYFFGFQPSLVFTAGAALVIFSIFLYSSSQSMLQMLKTLRKVQPV